MLLEEDEMQYAILIYRDPAAFEGLSEEEKQETTRQYAALTAESGVQGGAGLEEIDTATTVRVQDGQMLVTDGPFADTKEILAGFYLYEADTLDRALEFAARIPAARGGSIEVRPVTTSKG
jgi:hypothetical protein